MKKLTLYILIAVITGIAACSKILEKVDLNGIPDSVVWDNEGTANLYLNTIYNLVMPVWPSNYSATTLPTALHNVSDDAAGGGTATSAAILSGTLTIDNVTDFYGSGATNSAYTYIRKINILINSIDGGSISTDAKNTIKAQAYFLRAWQYFELVKLYGGVPYITHPEDWITEDLNKPRNKTSECIDSMITDLDHCSVLPAVWSNAADKGRITRGAALALKAKILLYWASPQFSATADNARWENAYKANKNAYDTLTKDGYALYPTFSRIFADANSATDKEPILFRAYNGSTTSGLFNSNENSRPYSESSGSGGQTNNPTWDLVKAFPMKDGKAITDPTSTYNKTYYWQNRDPRFGATIAYNGSLWQLSNKTGRRQYTYTGITEDKTRPTVTGFYSRKNVDSSLLAAASVNGKTFWVEMRLAEVMLNLAEAANATSRQTEAYDMLKLIRKRAGIDAGANNLYGLGASISKDSMATVILNERRIEFAFEGKRYDDLRRTRTFDKLNNTKRMALIIAPKAPATVASLEAKDANGVLFRDKLNMDGTDYTTYFTATETPISGEVNINFLSSYYFYAIPTTNITKNPNMKQTIGWTGGSFDPLQ